MRNRDIQEGSRRTWESADHGRLAKSEGAAAYKETQRGTNEQNQNYLAKWWRDDQGFMEWLITHNENQVFLH